MNIMTVMSAAPKSRPRILESNSKSSRSHVVAKQRTGESREDGKSANAGNRFLVYSAYPRLIQPLQTQGKSPHGIGKEQSNEGSSKEDE